MSSFTSRLEVSPMPDGLHWKLIRPFSYDVGSEGSGNTITVPAGFITDFASFPRILWRCLMWWLPGWAKYSKPSPLHDYLYQFKGFHRAGKAAQENRKEVEVMLGLPALPGILSDKLDEMAVWIDITRKYADDIFLEAMLVAWRKHRSGPAIAWLEYIGVRAFGWLAWRSK